MRKAWYDYLWIWSIVYFSLGFYNILFAWLGMIDFFLPIIISIAGGGKFFCNRFCGRGQLFNLCGTKLKLSRMKSTPRWMSTKYFRYGFLLFFLVMFGTMVWNTYLVAVGTVPLKKVIQLFWTFKVPWQWVSSGSIFPAWVVQFSLGFYSLMLTSTLIGLMVMLLFKPRTWCAFCPMGTMTQEICKIKVRKLKGGSHAGEV